MIENQSFRLSRDLANIRSSCWRCSVKKVFLKLSHISEENTCVEVSFNKVASYDSGVSRDLLGMPCSAKDFEAGAQKFIIVNFEE